MEIENPPAFPYSTIDGYTNEGMSLRDWFAGQALSGLIGNPNNEGRADELAKVAYGIGDAMLDARTKQETPHER